MYLYFVVVFNKLIIYVNFQDKEKDLANTKEKTSRLNKKDTLELLCNATDYIHLWYSVSN